MLSLLTLLFRWRGRRFPGFADFPLPKAQPEEGGRWNPALDTDLQIIHRREAAQRRQNVAHGVSQGEIGKRTGKPREGRQKRSNTVIDSVAY